MLFPHTAHRLYVIRKRSGDSVDEVSDRGQSACLSKERTHA